MGTNFSYKMGISTEEHDAFVKASSETNLLQSSAWAQVKSNWASERIGIYKGNEQVASMSILIKPLPLKQSIIYIPRGPVLDYSDKELLGYTFGILKKIGKEKKAIFVKFDPAILYKQYSINEVGTESEKAKEIIYNIISAGAKWTGLTMEIADSIQPRFQANRYLHDNLETSFPKHTKRLMKDAIRRGVKVKRSDISEIDVFANVVALTEERKKIALRNKAYFKKLMTIYGDDAYLHLATVNIAEHLVTFKSELARVEKDLSETLEHQVKRIKKLSDQKESLKKYISEFERYSVKYPDEVVIAGILSIGYGTSMEMLYAGMNEDFKKFYPQYLLYPKVFQDAFDNGIAWANMGGVEGSLDDGLTKFKANFNPTIEEFIGEFNIPINPLYYPANALYKLRKTLRNKH